MSDNTQELPGSALRWFECNGIYIAIDRTASSALPALGVVADKEAVVMDLIDAVLLDEQDPLLRFLDDWCSTAFDWRPWRATVSDEATEQGSEEAQEPQDMVAPVPLHELRGYPRLTGTLISLQGPSRKLLLAIDAESLSMMPEIPEAWQSLVKFQSHLMPYRLQLQQMQLNTEEVEKLEPGALVLLPQSFESDWSIRMEASLAGSILETHCKLHAFLDTTNSRFKLLPGAGPEPNGDAQSLTAGTDTESEFQSITVELEDSVPINELYTRSVWQSQLNLVLPLAQEFLGSRVVIRTDGVTEHGVTKNLPGTLMQVGIGYGVLLEQGAALAVE
ncbi:hypothetical protein [Granulosicoccus antarcticus]|uniref:Uncharacterized protein n=1 Tax=Granulosicoccus antarcticus IMCC3135 TaxID=1192854 RepID=A0A2Z2NKH5_9GAMM|nr:hypothetical protein [Granulosicoccus antarcticus]ASJ70511.1 hypothetical protein IMCC3135_01985 [Granulosicoccus antarcticus IMCC3135]